MWLLVLAGLLAVSAGKESSGSSSSSVAATAEKSSSSPDDLVLLEIDLKDPAKRSPVTATAVYGASPSQYVIRHGDESQELTPEYLGLLQQYTHTQQAPQPQARRPLPGYAKQQQQLQQAYQNSRVPAVAPPRPRSQLHPQALAQAEAAAQIQAQIDAQSRAEALQAARLGAGSSAAPTYVDPKLGSFEQELLQLVSANQAQEFKLARGPAEAGPRYVEQSYADQLPEQYHVETSAGRYHQPSAQTAYQAQAQEDVSQIQYQTPRYQPKQAKAFRPSPRYQDPQEQVNLKALQQQAEAQAIAQAQAEAQAQALAFQRISHASHNKHQQAALEQIRLNNEQHRQAVIAEEARVRSEQQRQTNALEQIQNGAHVSEAGQAHLTAQAEEQAHPRPVDHEAQLKAQLKAQAHAEAAAARRAQEAAEFKAHADAIRNLQAQQQAHVKAQEDAHRNALALERNQLRAQAHAQALAQAQAEALYKHQQQVRAKAHGEAQAAARAQTEARKTDPNAPVVQYLLPTSVPLPPPNSYFTNEQIQKYATSASSYVPRSTQTPKAQDEQSYAQQQVNQPRQAHKYKAQPQSSIYVSQSGIPKKAPVKSLTIEEIIEQDQQNSPQVVRLPSLSGPQSLTQEDVAALISAGYSVTPVPPAKPAQRTAYPDPENSSVGYYKKQRSPEYGYDEAQVSTAQRRPARRQRLHQVAQETDSSASEKVLYVVRSDESSDAKE
ncbi:polyglutamine-repeat protein pqn-41-like [Diprion similis]|uniref:polyglutamine-repeat protein pqn-41-like n=1 Tax=Diprion similis TaxID=362088 RepID=UPI001EF8FA2D|nr:polyglutamine-repeat protein pqn-41-like [Diprion similis]